MMTNCINCGSPLHFEKGRDTNEYATCSYCGTEFKRNNLGVVSTNRVKIMFDGHLLDMYVGSITYESIFDTYRLVDGTVHETLITRPELTLELHGYCIDEEYL